MKTPFTTQKTSELIDIDALIDQEFGKIKEGAYNNGISYGMRDLPLPLGKGDKLIHFIGEIKAASEKIAMKVQQIICPASNLPEGEIESNWAEMHNKRLEGEKERINKMIKIIREELGKKDPTRLAMRIRQSKWLCAGLFVGETALNTQAFQVTGDNLISCLIISASVSFAISMGAHFAGRKYKDAKTTFERRMILIVSAVGITVVSGIIASLRSIFLHRIGVDVSPLYFTIFNIAFFLIASIATFYIHPSKKEIEQNEEALQKYHQLMKLEGEKKQKEKEQLEHEITSKEKIIENMRAPVDAEYALERIKKQYVEAVETFKGANLKCRKEVPDCFSDPIPSLDIPVITFNQTINKYKNENNHNRHSSRLAN